MNYNQLCSKKPYVLNNNQINKNEFDQNRIHTSDGRIFDVEFEGGADYRIYSHFISYILGKKFGFNMAECLPVEHNKKLGVATEVFSKKGMPELNGFELLNKYKGKYLIANFNENSFSMITQILGEAVEKQKLRKTYFNQIKQAFLETNFLNTITVSSYPMNWGVIKNKTKLTPVPIKGGDSCFHLTSSSKELNYFYTEQTFQNTRQLFNDFDKEPCETLVMNEFNDNKNYIDDLKYMSEDFPVFFKKQIKTLNKINIDEVINETEKYINKQIPWIVKAVVKDSFNLRTEKIKQQFNHTLGFNVNLLKPKNNHIADEHTI